MHLQFNPQRLLLWSVSLILIFALSLGEAAIAVPPSLATVPVSNKVPLDRAPLATGREVFEKAYDRRYTWDEDFPGFQAEVSVNHNGKEEHGLVRITPPDLKVSVLNISDPEIREIVDNQLKMEVVHRKRVPFEVLHANQTFEIKGLDEKGAAEIKENGEDSNSSYKVQDNQITQVNRVFGDVAVTVDTVGTIKANDGYVPIHTQSVFRDAQTGDVLEKHDVRDFYEKIGGYYLLTNRTIRRSAEGNPEMKLTPDTTIRFNDIQPLT